MISNENKFKQMQRLVWVIPLILLSACAYVSNRECKPINNNVEYVDTAIHRYYYLDGKHVSEKKFSHYFLNYKLEYQFWSHDSRDAVTVFGEKYRKGIYGFKVIGKK